jgi:hypothetical protein
MTGIEIFIAGGTKRAEQKRRDEIRTILSKLQNRRFGKHLEQVAFYVRDYNDFPEPKQEIFDAHIKNIADIVIFLVDANFVNEKQEKHTGTYAELVTSCESYKLKNRPEIIVLYRTDDTSTKEFRKWADAVQSIDSTKRYIIAKEKYKDLYERLKHSFTGNSNDGLIDRLIEKKRQEADLHHESEESAYSIGDIYSNSAIKGIIAYIDKSSRTCKIISLETHTGTWNERKKFSQGGWRLPDASEIQNIISDDKYLTHINQTLKENHKRSINKKENIWCEAGNKREAPHVYICKSHTVESRDHTYQGHFRLIADVKY